MARGMDKFTFRATDAAGLSATGTVTVLVDGKIRIMPLGDSIAAGITSNNSPPSSTRVGFRLDLFSGLTTLSAGKYGIDFVGSQSDGAGGGLSDTNHEGHPGWCDDNNPYCAAASGQAIAPSVIGFLNTNPADIVLLHIGTNEFSTSNVGVDTILANVSAWAGSNYPVSVFVARIIPTSTGILDVQAFNDNVAAIVTDRPNVGVFSVDQQSELHQSGNPDLNLADPALMGDTYHPNSAGYTKMANRWKADLIAAGILPDCP
jgi:lysophospholipase L1-like esterase